MLPFIKYFTFGLFLCSLLLCNNATASAPAKNVTTDFELTISDTVLCPDSIAKVTVSMPGVKNGFFSYTHLGFSYSKSLSNGTRTFEVYERGKYTITSYGEIADDGSILSITNSNISFTIAYHRLPEAFVAGGGTFCRFNTITPLNVNLTGEAPWNLRYNLNNSEIVEKTFTTSPATIADINSASINLISLNDKNCKAIVSGSGSLEIIETPEVDLIGDTVFCPNSTANYLLTYDPGYKYTWYVPDGATSIPQEVFQPHKITLHWNKPGIYDINFEVSSIKNSCTTGTLTKSVYVLHPPSVKSDYDTIVCFRHKDFVNLFATSQEENTVFWLDYESNEHPLPITDTGVYHYIESIPFGCSDTGAIRVHEKCIPEVFVPEAFTPNGDGINDELIVFGNYFDLTLEIYTSVGQLIFTYNQEEQFWDGTFEGADANNGVYYWKAYFKSEIGEPYYSEGQLTLIR